MCEMRQGEYTGEASYLVDVLGVQKSAREALDVLLRADFFGDGPVERADPVVWWSHGFVDWMVFVEESCCVCGRVELIMWDCVEKIEISEMKVDLES